jgi:hypothetical protein
MDIEQYRMIRVFHLSLGYLLSSNMETGFGCMLDLII